MSIEDPRRELADDDPIAEGNPDEPEDVDVDEVDEDVEQAG